MRGYETIKATYKQVKKGFASFNLDETPGTYIMKWISIIAEVVYPDIIQNCTYSDYMLGEDGCMYDGHGNLISTEELYDDESGDMNELIYEYEAYNSSMIPLVLTYMRKSPFWDYKVFQVSDFMDLYAKEDCREKLLGKLYACEGKGGKKFFSPDFFSMDYYVQEDLNPYKVFKELCECVEYDSLVIIRCELAEEINDALTIALQFEDKSLHEELEEVYKALKWWFNGENAAFTHGGIGWYLNTDNATYGFETGGYYNFYGVIDCLLHMLVAPHYMEALLLEVDKRKVFLKNEVREELKKHVEL